jgi:carbonic anhydrase
VIVCGHYGCGGVEAAWKRTRLGLIDNWLRYVQDVAQRHHALLDHEHDPQAAMERLAELNVLEQVLNVCRTTVIGEAWRRGQSVAVHGWIYGLADGIMRNLGMSVTGESMVPMAYERALAALVARAGTRAEPQRAG